MNNSVTFQLNPPYFFLGVDFLNMFLQINISVAMVTNQINGFGLK